MRLVDFLRDERGAVTVDWTVLAAAVVGLGISAIAAVRTGVVNLGGDINTSLAGASVAALGTLGGGGAPSPQDIRDGYDVVACSGGLDGVYEFGRASVDAGMGHFDNYADSDAHVDGWLDASPQELLSAIDEYNRWVGDGSFSDDELIQFAAAHCLAQAQGLI
ncbi:hypothetical protein [Pararhodobacter sp.]|uniref:Flp family type IVb pilin n=1 Tax=Pararhodobacter sp. TaxID=2127056 RepID=UPI002AFFA544|nr:hypothetical protein [Pararhodobacter sp.]